MTDARSCVHFGAASPPPARPGRRAVAAALLTGALGVSAAAVPAAASTTPPADRVVRATLLPVPPAGQDRRLSVTAVDVSPSGTVVGTVLVTTTDGTATVAEVPRLWTAAPHGGWHGRRLTLPPGATGGSAAGLSDRGEAGGAVTLDGVSRAARWSADGRTVTLIGDAGSRVGAVGPDGPWGVSAGGADPAGPAGTAELVTRDGARTPLRGTPQIDAGHRRDVSSIGGPDTALVWVSGGAGRGWTARPVLWRDGATAQLPVFNSVDLPSACVSAVQADGSVVAGGFSVAGGTPRYVVIRHVGGVAGTDVALAPAPGSGRVGISCEPGQSPDSLASDGGVAGHWSTPERSLAAYWNAGNAVTVVPPAAGERSAVGVAVADGGRMVIRAEGDDGRTRLSLWRNGVRTPLAVPAGWTVNQVVELTDSGLVVANVKDAAGTVRPAVWQVA